MAGISFFLPLNDSREGNREKCQPFKAILFIANFAAIVQNLFENRGPEFHSSFHRRFHESCTNRSYIKIMLHFNYVKYLWIMFL